MTTLDPATLAALRTLAGRMLPACPELGAPGADDDAIFSQLTAAARQAPDAFTGLLNLLLERADRLATAPLSEMMAELGGAQPAAFGWLSVTMLSVYYRDDRVLRAFGQDPRPPFPKGYQVPEGDFSLLEPVRARGPIWRRAD